MRRWSHIAGVAGLLILALQMGIAPGYEIEPIFDGSVSAGRRAAIRYACNLWSGWLSASSATGEANSLEIRFRFADLGTSPEETTLGQITAFGEWQGTIAGRILTPAQYMIAGDRDKNGAGVDNICTFNSNAAVQWYDGTDGNVPPGSIDLVSVVLHEVGHALGFVDTFGESEPNAWGKEYGAYYYLTRWDELLRDKDGDAPIPSDQGPDAFDELNTVTFVGANAKAIYGDAVPIYAPDPFEKGSSLCHTDYWSGLSGLMVPTVATGLDKHGLADFEVGMFNDLGWRLSFPTAVRARRVSGYWQYGHYWQGGLPPGATSIAYLDASSKGYPGLFTKKSGFEETIA